MSVLEMSDGAVELGGRTVWRDASFQLEAGTITAVLGPNGSGKSTLLKVVLGLIPLSGGMLRVFGERPERGSRRVGYMAQSRVADTMSAMTGRDYVGLGFDGPRFGWGHDRTKREVVREALILTGTELFADRPLASLSGGQRQRIAMAHATVFQPGLLLLDEPLAALDIAAQSEIVELTSTVSERTGAAVVVVAHDLNPLSAIVDQVLWIARRQVRSGTVDDVVNEATLSDLYGHPIEIVVTPRGRRVIVGLEEEFAHPHPHGSDHSHENEHAHGHEAHLEGAHVHHTPGDPR
ncbi:MAG: ATP-binding cassette domain-containing protein [Acidimicrobiaceae bacterium]|nr:ATP-binding cassette domain-containing protein [Acidimicrobiaceae bacterium]